MERRAPGTAVGVHGHGRARRPGGASAARVRAPAYPEGRAAGRAGAAGGGAGDLRAAGRTRGRRTGGTGPGPAVSKTGGDRDAADGYPMGPGCGAATVPPPAPGT